MIEKTEVIVLGTVKYGDNSLILRTYSREQGLLSFIAGSVRSRKGPLKPAMAQVLSVLQVVYYGKTRGELKRIKEVGVAEPLKDIFYHPVKSSLAMFLAEILQHVIHEEEPNQALYRYLHQAIYQLDEATEGLGSFHLKFLYTLAGYLGFQPEQPQGELPYFDLYSGTYVVEEPVHAHFLRLQQLANWRLLHRHADHLDSRISLSGRERRELLEALLLYYRLHIKDFGSLRSLEVLTELLS